MNLILQHLSLVNFKNYEAAELEFSPDVNCLVGNNGSGKTNILDAIHYLGFCKSHYNPIDSQNIRHEEPFFMIQGQYLRNDENDKVYCAVKRGQKKIFKRNDKEYDRLADHVGLFPSVIITPGDIDLISEGSEVRRRFVDIIISQYNHVYLQQLIVYNKVLQQRNNLLKHFAAERKFELANLEAWDAQLIEYGTPIWKERRSFIEKFTPLFNDYYKRISNSEEQVSLEYQSPLNAGDFAEILLKARNKDRALQRSTVGIHKDDLEFLIDGYPLKKFGSQGQQKSYLIALKLAQFQFIKEACNVLPLLLLDDIFDKIDDHRVAQLMTLVSEHQFGQIFITDTHGKRVPELFKDMTTEMRIFEVNNGTIKSSS